MASQWRMMWWKLRRHRLAVISGAVLGVLYLSIFASEFLAPYALNSRHNDYIYAPPQRIHLFHEGQFEGRRIRESSRVQKLFAPGNPRWFHQRCSRRIDNVGPVV